MVAEVVASDLRRSRSCLYQGMVEIPPLVLWKDYLSMQGHCSADSRVPFVSAEGEEAIGSCC